MHKNRKKIPLEMQYRRASVIIILLCLFSFFSGKYKIFLNFTLFDLFSLLFGILLIIFSILNLFFFKKKNYKEISIILVFFILIFQTSRLNNFNFSDLSNEQQCIIKNIEYEKNKQNKIIEKDYLDACKLLRD
ncbi:hypothetical protein IDG88_00385 [Pelagibacterales bacterium SAG-MED03]|nr:hypothetical protein [Pelagibacterales bacterium SAG-MED03]